MTQTSSAQRRTQKFSRGGFIFFLVTCVFLLTLIIVGGRSILSQQYQQVPQEFVTKPNPVLSAGDWNSLISELCPVAAKASTANEQSRLDFKDEYGKSFKNSGKLSRTFLAEIPESSSSLDRVGDFVIYRVHYGMTQLATVYDCPADRVQNFMDLGAFP